MDVPPYLGARPSGVVTHRPYPPRRWGWAANYRQVAAIEAAAGRARTLANSRRVDGRTCERNALPSPTVAEDSPAAWRACRLRTVALPTPHVRPTTSAHWLLHQRTLLQRYSEMGRLCTTGAISQFGYLGQCAPRALVSTRARALDANQDRAVALTEPKEDPGTSIRHY